MKWKCIAVTVILAPLCFGQGYTLENFSSFASGHTLISGDTTTLNNAWFGTGTTGGSTINNSASPLTIQSGLASGCGSAPPNHTGKYLDYSTTLGNGSGNQEIELNWPVSGASTISQIMFWFCSPIPNAVSFGTTFDAFAVIAAGGSRIANYTSNGATQTLTFEGFNNNGHGGGGAITYTPGTQVLVILQVVSGAGGGGQCADHTNFTDCDRMRAFTVSGGVATQLGDIYDDCNCTALASDITFGNINSITAAGYNGYHVQFSDIWACFIGCSAGEFGTLQNIKFPWQGIITPGRATDWTTSGISGGIPSGSYTQCGSTLTAGSYTGAAITSSLAGCSANTYYLLGVGTFSLTGQLKLPASGKVVLRGSGANSTFINWVAGGAGAVTCAQASTLICLESSDGTFTTGPPSNTCTWSAGYTQGGTAVTLANLAGTCLTGISTSNPTLLFFDACDTGFSGSGCGTGTATDNSQWFVCGDIWNTTGCSADGPDSGGSRPERDELEIHTATAVNTGTGAVTITPPLIAANWAALSNPQVWIVQPAVNLGVENLSIDGSATGAPLQGIELFNCYKCWVSGVRFTNWTRASLNMFQTSNAIVQNNYVYTCTGVAPSCYGIRLSASANDLIQNNILQQVLSPIFLDGASAGHVIAYNFIVNNQDPSNTLSPAIDAHAGNYYDLIEGNIANQFSCDNIHGTCDHETIYRNLFPGWESMPSNTQTVFTRAIDDWAFARYTNNVGNVLGTPGYHTGYSGVNVNLDIYSMGAGATNGHGTIPTDTLTKSTSLFWASYDSKTAANRFCGNSLDTNWSGATNCNSASESPTAASTYPGLVPVFGDTTAGQGTMPASFYYTAKPSFFASTDPWPLIGPDVSAGNIFQCNGTINTVGRYNGAPSTVTNSGCSAGGTGWNGQVNANPAMNMFFSIGGVPDGSGSALPFTGVYPLSASSSSGSTLTGGTWKGVTVQ